MTDRREQSPVPQAVVEGVAGAMGGIVATLLTYPLMTVRFLLFDTAICIRYY